MEPQETYRTFNQGKSIQTKSPQSIIQLHMGQNPFNRVIALK